MGLALSLPILTVLPGITKAQEMASVQDTPTANQNADVTTVQSEPSDRLIVYPGDSLWSISQERLGPSASPKQIADEVGRTFELNRDWIGEDPNLILVGQELTLPSAARPVQTVASEPAPTTSEGPAAAAADEPPSEVSTETSSEEASTETPTEEASTETSTEEASAEQPAVLPELPEADAELVAASVEEPSSAGIPEGDGDERRKAGYAVLLFTFAVTLLGTARLLAKRH